MTNLRAAIFASPSVVVIVCTIHHGPVASHQAMRRVANDHLRAWIREVDWNVNLQGVLSVAGACYSNFNAGVTSGIDPSHSISAKILLKQLFLISKPRLLRCWPRHDANTALNASIRATENTALNASVKATEISKFRFPRKKLFPGKKHPRLRWYAATLATGSKVSGFNVTEDRDNAKGVYWFSWGDICMRYITKLGRGKKRLSFREHCDKLASLFSFNSLVSQAEVLVL